jgi:phosphocarrier protein HPr
MIQRELDIINKLGLHARAAAKLVECAARVRLSHSIAQRRSLG